MSVRGNILSEIHEWIDDPTVRRVAAYNLNGFLYMVRTGELATLKKDILNNLNNIVDKLLKETEYKSSFFPSIVSIKKGRNFWIRGYRPDPDENARILHLILTGVGIAANIRNDRATILTNIDGLTIDERREYINYLVKMRGKTTGEIYPAVGWQRVCDAVFNRYLPFRSDNGIYPYIYSFALISEFARWIFYRKELSPQEIMKRRLDLITIVAGRSVPNEFVVIPGISRFISTWFEDLARNREREYPSIGLFIGSFYNADEKDKSLSTINKFLYYFLNGYVSGELLNRLAADKVTSFLKVYKERKVKPYGAREAGYFFYRI